MNTAIMEEWLEWFDRRMEGRQVLLLLDNFSAHECALNSLELKNVRVAFLPPNTTSLCQPCDQGIIYALKGHYRRHFTRWCLEKWDDGREPLEEVNLLMAIRWVVDAWENDVKKSTLVNCFRKSRVLPLDGGEREGDREEGEANEQEERAEEEEDHEEELDLESEQAHIRDELEQMTLQLIAKRRVAQALPVDEYVAPSIEEVYDPEDDLTAHIVATIDIVDTESPEELGKEVLTEKVPDESALASIETLLAYAEQQSTSDGHMRALHSLLRVVKQRQTEMRRKHTQSTLDAWVD